MRDKEIRNEFHLFFSDPGLTYSRPVSIPVVSLYPFLVSRTNSRAPVLRPVDLPSSPPVSGLGRKVVLVFNFVSPSEVRVRQVLGPVVVPRDNGTTSGAILRPIIPFEGLDPLKTVLVVDGRSRQEVQPS